MASPENSTKYLKKNEHHVSSNTAKNVRQNTSKHIILMLKPEKYTIRKSQTNISEEY